MRGGAVFELLAPKPRLMAFGFQLMAFGFWLVCSAAAEPGARDWSEIFLGVNPSVSPDGSFFAFEWKDRVWLAPTEGGTAVPIGDGQSADRRPFISPDGRRVAFLSDRWEGTRQLFEASLEFDAAHGPAPVGASEARQVTFHTESLLPWGYTPDGAEMLAIGYRDDASESATEKRLSRRPFLVSMEGRKAERVLFDAPAFCPALSPDGRKVLFSWRARLKDGDLEFRKRHAWSKSPCNGEIWLYDGNARSFAPVVRRRDSCAWPIWTPGGDAFYYLSDADGVRNVYLRSLATGKERQITHFTDDHVFDPALSRDGRTMVFAKGFDLWRIDPTLDNPQPRRIALRPAGFNPSAPRTASRTYRSFDNNYGNGNCAFRDRGREVAFTAGGDVWAMALGNEDAARPVRIHGSSRTQERDCAFSPDGDTLYYLSDRGDGADVWRARRANAGKPWSANTDFVRECLVTGDVCRLGLSVSPDGRLLAWHDMQGRLSFADTNGAVHAVSRVASAQCESYAWSPDGRFVAAALRDGHNNVDVWILPTGTGNGEREMEPCNISRHWKWDGTPAWSPDGRVIAFSGNRAATDDASLVFYAYLDPADEYAEASGGAARNAPCDPDFATLPDRVRATGVKGKKPIFSPDGRTLAVSCNGGISTIRIPGRLKPEKLLDKRAVLLQWLKDGDRDVLLSSVSNRLAVGDRVFEFKVSQTTDVRDYQELAFLTAWANVRDGFCDPNLRGTDWPAVREKYRLAARNAPCWSAFARVLGLMHGELDASHLVFSANATARKRWADFPWTKDGKVFTAHLGVRFDRGCAGEGWLVRDVIPGSPADGGAAGLLPGDVILSVDGREVSPGMDYAEAMNGPLPRKCRLRVKRAGCDGPLKREIAAISFGKARRLLRGADIAAARAAVRMKGNFGYIAVDAMDADGADAFADQVFAEGFGRDGLVIDVRYNTGGSTADRLIDILCGSRYERTLYRGADAEGYHLDRYGRPVLADLPVVVLANERSMSNGEEFACAMQALKRAKVVGRETAGEVIGSKRFTLLDYGEVRRPRVGTFLPDGTDMEGHGAKPDIEIDLTPADVAAGRDPQLDAAADALAAEAAARKASPPPPLRYAR